MFTSWHPGVKLNPQNKGKKAINPCGLIILHQDGCTSSILFKISPIPEVFGEGRDYWDVISLDPIHVEPSIMRKGEKNCAEPDHTNCKHHDHHGFIRGGKWDPCSDDGQSA